MEFFLPKALQPPRPPAAEPRDRSRPASLPSKKPLIVSAATPVQSTQAQGNKSKLQQLDMLLARQDGFDLDDAHDLANFELINERIELLRSGMSLSHY
jgi:hypothetical protein